MTTKESGTTKQELSNEILVIISETLNDLFNPENLKITESVLLEYEQAFKVMSNLCRRAAEIHHGLQVPWQRMCYEAMIPAGTTHLKHSQDKLEMMLNPLNVGLIRQDKWSKGAALPNFYPCEERPDILADLTKYEAEPSKEI